MMMTHRRCCRLLPLMVLAVLPWVGPGFAEVSVDESGGKITGLAFMQVTGGGGGEPLPWPLVRQHVPADWVLNPGGSDRVPPDGEPSLGWDPVGDRPEVAWARHDGEDFEIVIASWLGDRWSEPRPVTENAVDDLAPSLAYGPDGTARIAFEREGRVWVVRRPPGGDWSAPEEVDQGSSPTVAATAVERVAYQQAGEDSTEVVVSRRDAGGGWVPEVVATTTFEGLDGDGNVDGRLHASADGRVWVDWEDSAEYLGWSELQDGGGWSAPRYESLSGPDDEEAARLRIELQVMRH